MTAPSPERTRLSAVLRELKARTGLSLAGLAAKTAFSKSSWDRYLNGRTLPPRDAVQELCRLAGEAEGRCLALWEIAESEGSGRGGRGGPVAQAPRSSSPTASPAPVSSSPPPPSPPPSLSPSPPPTATSAPAPTPAATSTPAPQEATHPGSATPVGIAADDTAVHRSATVVAVLVSVCAVVVGGVAAVALLLPHRDGTPRASLSPPPSATGPRCRGAVCEGRSPMQMRCAAAPETLALYQTPTGAWMELRYSEECGTSWARMWQTRVGDRLEMSASGRDGDGIGGVGAVGDKAVRGAEVHNAVDADAYVYTPMTVTRPGTVVRACFRPAAGGEGDCFDARVSK